MGIQSAHFFAFKSVPLEWAHLSFILHEIAREKGAAAEAEADDNNTGTVPHSPVMDVDANCIGFRGVQKANGPISQVWALVRNGTDDGIEVNLITDGGSRDSSKRASASRSAQREKMSLKSLELEIELCTLLQTNGNDDDAKDVSERLKKS